MIRLHPVAGHGAARDALTRAHSAAGLPSAMLFHGPRGVGKQRMALWTAQLQVCTAPAAGGPCDQCVDCRMALGLEHPDIHWYFPLARPKGASGDRLGDALESARIQALIDVRVHPLRASLGDELRGLYLAMVQNLRRRAYVSPSNAPVQTFIIADAEFLVPQESSPEAANALLKLLEEPPKSTRFVLTSSEPGRLLPTIRSRSVPLHLSPLPDEEVADFLVKSTGVDRDTAAWAARLSAGSIGRALGFLPDDDGDPGPLEELRRAAFRLVQAGLSAERAPGYAAALQERPAGARSMVELFYFVEEWVRDLGAVAAGAPHAVRNQDSIDRLRSLVEAKGVQAPDAATALAAVEEAREMARGNVNPQLIVSGLVRRLRRDLRPRRLSPAGNT